MNLFEKIGIDEKTVRTITNMGITNPTEIQEKSIPAILEGKDVIGESATGSGKTLAFAFGVIKQVAPREGLQALILTPTRELSEQVKNALIKFAGHLNITNVYGGVSIDPQIKSLRQAEVVVATPGRLLDHLKRRTIDLSRVKLLVLDEADRMLDMGFIDDVEDIIRNCPKKRQTLFFSATISSKIKDLANKYMIHPVRVSARNHVDPNKLKQVYYNVSKDLKLSLLIHLLQEERAGLVMVFCNTRSTVDFVTRNLKSNKVNAIAIHGGLTQNKRTTTIDMFNNGKVGVLVCTDVAARGLHIENVSHVYNYEIPKDPKDYVHRIGRTARAGEEGKAVNILCEYDYDNFSRILHDYSEFSIKKLDSPHVNKVTISKEQPRSRGFKKTYGNRSGNRFPRRFNSNRGDSDRREGPRRKPSRKRI